MASRITDFGSEMYELEAIHSQTAEKDLYFNSRISLKYSYTPEYVEMRVIKYELWRAFYSKAEKFVEQYWFDVLQGVKY